MVTRFEEGIMTDKTYVNEQIKILNAIIQVQNKQLNQTKLALKKANDTMRQIEMEERKKKEIERQQYSISW